MYFISTLKNYEKLMYDIKYTQVHTSFSDSMMDHENNQYLHTIKLQFYFKCFFREF